MPRCWLVKTSEAVWQITRFLYENIQRYRCSARKLQLMHFFYGSNVYNIMTMYRFGVYIYIVLSISSSPFVYSIYSGNLFGARRVCYLQILLSFCECIVLFEHSQGSYTNKFEIKFNCLLTENSKIMLVEKSIYSSTTNILNLLTSRIRIKCAKQKWIRYPRVCSFKLFQVLCKIYVQFTTSSV